MAGATESTFKTAASLTPLELQCFVVSLSLPVIFRSSVSGLRFSAWWLQRSPTDCMEADFWLDYFSSGFPKSPRQKFHGFIRTGFRTHTVSFLLDCSGYVGPAQIHCGKGLGLLESECREPQFVDNNPGTSS